MTVKELFEKYPPKEFGKYVKVERAVEKDYKGEFRVDQNWDYADYEEDNEQVDDLGWAIYLPHSCNSWVIGTPEEAEEMAVNILDAVNYCKERP